MFWKKLAFNRNGHFMLIILYTILLAFRDKHQLFSYNLFSFHSYQLFFFSISLLFYSIRCFLYYHSSVWIIHILRTDNLSSLSYNHHCTYTNVVDKDTQAWYSVFKLAYNFSIVVVVYIWASQFAVPFMHSIFEGFISCANKKESFQMENRNLSINT